MAGFLGGLRHFVPRAAFAVAAALAMASPASAQWLFPFGAAPPAEIVQRLRAEGFVLAHPLIRKDTVYLGDVVRGPRGRERLVIDAWSGEILQRFLARRGGFVPEGGEFTEPPPLSPPPARDFREGEFEHGPPGVFEPPRPRTRQKPAAAVRDGAEPKPTSQPTERQNPGGGSPAAAPTTPQAPSAIPRPAAEPPREAQPSPAPASAAPPAEAKQSGPVPTPSSAPEKPAGNSERKLNDVPVNPLD